MEPYYEPGDTIQTSMFLYKDTYKTKYFSTLNIDVMLIKKHNTSIWIVQYCSAWRPSIMYPC